MKLTAAEKTCLAHYHIGGVEALRTETYTAACSTLRSLHRKGLIGQRGLTDQGKVLAKEFADAEHAASMGGLAQ